MSARGLEAALAGWREALGDAHVLVDDATIAAASTTTFATTQRPCAVLRPSDAAQVQGVLRVARRARVPVYPESAGRNWGYGGVVPVQDGCAILDLRRMDRVVAHDERQGYVVVEPGVTMQALAEHLVARRSSLLPGNVGGSPLASVVGNLVERGHGTGLNNDRAAHLCSLEVVLPTGELVRTGYAGFEDARSAHVDRWGLGPGLDALFLQSNLGVVTRATVWLPRRANECAVALFFLKDDRKLAAAVDALHEARRAGVVQGSSGFWNDYRLLASSTQYPFDEARGERPLPAALLQRARARFGDARWVGTASMYAPTFQEGLLRQVELRRLLGGKVDRLLVFDRATRAVLRAVRRPVKAATGFDLVEALGDVFGENELVVPNAESVRSVYWRKRGVVPSDMHPERDRCGVLWCTASVPYDGADARFVVDTMRARALGHGFEPQIALIGLSDRSLRALLLLAYDRDEPGEDARALRCHDDVLHTLQGRGYHPVRLGIQAMDRARAPSPAYVALLRRLKRALDPDDVLAPGRYDFRAAWSDE